MRLTLPKNYVALTVWRIVVLYAIMALLRVIFYIYNMGVIGAVAIDEIPRTLLGCFIFDTASIAYANALWIILALIPLRSRIKKGYQTALFWIYMVVNGFMVVFLNMADALYFNNTLKRVNSDEMHFADNDNTLEVMWIFAKEHWGLVIITALVIWALKLAYGRDVKLNKESASSLIFYPANTMLLMVAGALCAFGIRGCTLSGRPMTLSYAMHYTTNNNIANTILSNPFATIRSMGKKRIEVPKHFSQEQLGKIYSPYHYPTNYNSPTKGKFEGYNVMIFILESFSAENSALISPDLYSAEDATKGKGYMPFLDSLMRESVTLKNFYATERRSVCAMPAILGSIPSLDTPFSLMPESIGQTNQMPAMVAKEGYTTAFFCGSPAQSMGFAGYARSAGVQNCFSMENYEAAHGKGDYDGAWGIFDEPFLAYTQEELTKLKEPFLASVFTVSSHHPFTVPEKYKNVVPKGESGIQPVTAYTDIALRNFFENAKGKEWFNRTIFVFTADHVANHKVAERAKVAPGTHHIIGAIYTPDGSLKRGVIDEVTQQTDIMPTILAMIGNKEPFFSFGRDIFNKRSDRPKWAIFHNGVTTAVTTENSRTKMIKVTDPKSKMSDKLRAFEQQYFDHISRQTYVVPTKEE